MRIAVIGAGIMGASTVYHLARPGIDVHLFDLAPGPAEGVTHNAFGWVNTINGDPRSAEAYELRIRAVAEYNSLLVDLPELLPHVRRGSLVWKDSPAATVSLAVRHRADQSLELVTRNFILAKEPRLKRPPDLAIYSARDIAIDPGVLARSLIARAEQSGAVLHYGVRVQQLERTERAVTAIQTDSGRFQFDRVVLAAGTHTARLLDGIGVSLALEASPVVLLHYRTNERFLRNILSSPEIEVRQAPDHTVLVVEDFYSGCEEMDFKLPRLRVTQVLDETFVMPEAFAFSHGAVGSRPVFANGLPRTGFVQDVAGLYLLVAHPGIILAPLLSRLAAEELLYSYP